ncbi:SpvB/TcaC N-terminal domain-containing protein [Flexithrix dorotheae]|uniref:SpvB/TcaC N-terminal domain-containing protein n=1 Tax=Flexithrix dorotheae TaxID=70993 RepID=UPI0003737D69|nr:SpvB/TcaC N-terminal domain-containing protein [Flexithrix dorotheae]
MEKNGNPQKLSHLNEQSDGINNLELPHINLPKGGGAIKGIDEKFNINPLNGTANISIPLPLSPNRNNFFPDLALQYNSGGGNSPFGLGWQLNMSSIQIKTEKALPKYTDEDIYQLTGIEDLEPYLERDSNNEWQHVIKEENGFIVSRYRPRTETSHDKIEKIEHAFYGCYWKVTNRENIVTFYGKSEMARITDPAETKKIFKWLAEFSYDNKGNWIQYEYKKEDLENVPNLLHETHRFKANLPFANCYPKRVIYGNKTPYYPDSSTAFYPVEPLQRDSCFELVFDYGEHDVEKPTPDEEINRKWDYREDAFSSYRTGFEIRTFRLCKRILMFHYFNELDPKPCLVKSLELNYTTANFDNSETLLSETSYLFSAVKSGYIKQEDGHYSKKSIPPITFEYQLPEWDTNVKYLSEKHLVNSPVGLTNGYQWVDLYGEGIPGILTEQGDAWYYKQNLGDNWGSGDRFSPIEQVTTKPAINGLNNGRLALQDLEASGEKQIVIKSAGLSGFHQMKNMVSEVTADIASFIPFENIPNTDWKNQNARYIDLNGDGRPELVVSEENAFLWYESMGKKGYAEGKKNLKPFDEDTGPAMVFSDEGESIFLADFSGDGLTDIIRIRNGEICYWPNLGYGNFGSKISMANAPLFDFSDTYHSSRIYLADISGTGATDIIYLEEDRFKVYINQAGNGWSSPKEIAPFVPVDNRGKFSVIDLLGTGTGCIVWSSDLPNEHPMRYIDLMGSKKPHIMTGYSNNLGKEVSFGYKSSTYFYLKAKEEGTPWVTKLPFPVHVIESIHTKDHISSSQLNTSYCYYHGYYDHEEREFRGFGRVDQIDQETFDSYQEEDKLDIPPVLSKTWIHTGSYLNQHEFSKQFQKEYFQDSGIENQLPDSEIENTDGFSYQDYREAVRCIKGRTLRQEIYSLDGSEKESKPYTIRENNYTIRRLQPRKENHYGVFQTFNRETITLATERNTDDPRVAHQFGLLYDEYGNPLQSLEVVYPRKSGSAGIRPEQMKLHAFLQTMQFENEVNLYYRLGLVQKQTHYEIGGLSLELDAVFAFEDVFSQLENILDNPNVLLHHEIFTSGVQAKIMGAKIFTYKEGNLRHLALTDHQETMVMSNHWAGLAYNGKVNDALLQESGYQLKDDHWWVSSDKIDYLDASGFYLPNKSEDVFGNVSSIGYDEYYLTVKETVDALQNKVIGEINYRTLSLNKITDINDNVSETLTNELGMVVATTTYGTEEGIQKGDDPINLYQPIPVPSLEDIIDNPNVYLQGATSYFYYHLENWENGHLPPHFIQLQREIHKSDNPNEEISQIQISLGYTDGFGRALQNKIKHSENKWLVSGRTIYNNKEKPVKQYEPFFSDTYLFQSEHEIGPVGVTPVFHYDPLGRLIKTESPDGFHSKITIDSWEVTHFDQNDTILDSKAYLEGILLPANDPKRIALNKAIPHYNTPLKVILDSLGREFCVEQIKEEDGEPFINYTEFDTLGNPLTLTDPRQFVANKGRNETEKIYNFKYTYDLLGNVLSTNSSDAGVTYNLINAKGNPLYFWNARDYQTKILYDTLHRPLETLVEGPDLNILAQKIIYGNDKSKNQNGQVIVSYDQSGKSENLLFNFKGQLLHSTQQLCSQYKKEPDWAHFDQVDMEPEVYYSKMEYDALGKIIKSILPDGSVHIPKYHDIGWLKSVEVKLRGNIFGEESTNLPTNFVNDISYDAKGQRSQIIYGNGVRTSYYYDEKNFRLTKLLTQRPQENGGQAMLQDIQYIYDPVGNLVQISDISHTQVFNAGQQVDATMNYVYDALYQLTQATGREHLGLTKNTHQQYADVLNSSQFVHINDANGLGNFNQNFTYDESGNLIKIQHTGNNSYTRNITASPTSNRCITDEMDSSIPMEENFDAAGNLNSLEHLAGIDWNYRNNIASATIIERQIEDENGNPLNISDAEYYVYDASGQRIRKIKETYNRNGDLLWKEEKIYLGGLELKRKYQGNNQQLKEHRSTIHITDGEKRIALVHYWDNSNDNSVSVASHKIHYQLGNHLGSASMEVDAQGHLISYEEYYPFGGTAYTTGSSLAEVKLKEYRYTGKERDNTTGLYYYGARYYAPWMGRWLNPDPAGTVDGLNLYVFVRNNPLKLVDIKGTSSSRPDWLIKVQEGNDWENVTNEMLDQAVLDGHIKGYASEVRLSTPKHGTYTSADKVVFFNDDTVVVNETKLSGSTELTGRQKEAAIQIAEKGEVDMDSDSRTYKHLDKDGKLVTGKLEKTSFKVSAYTIWRKLVPEGTHTLGHMVIPGMKTEEIAKATGSSKASIEHISESEKIEPKPRMKRKSSQRGMTVPGIPGKILSGLSLGFGAYEVYSGEKTMYEAFAPEELIALQKGDFMGLAKLYGESYVTGKISALVYYNPAIALEGGILSLVVAVPAAAYIQMTESEEDYLKRIGMDRKEPIKFYGL